MKYIVGSQVFIPSIGISGLVVDIKYPDSKYLEPQNNYYIVNIYNNIYYFLEHEVEIVL